MSDHDGVEQVITMAWRAQFEDLPINVRPKPHATAT